MTKLSEKLAKKNRRFTYLKFFAAIFGYPEIIPVVAKSIKFCGDGG